MRSQRSNGRESPAPLPRAPHRYPRRQDPQGRTTAIGRVVKANNPNALIQFATTPLEARAPPPPPRAQRSRSGLCNCRSDGQPVTGRTMPSTPAPSQLRMIAPRFPGSVTPSTAIRNGGACVGDRLERLWEPLPPGRALPEGLQNVQRQGVAWLRRQPALDSLCETDDVVRCFVTFKSDEIQISELCDAGRAAAPERLDGPQSVTRRVLAGRVDASRRIAPVRPAPRLRGP